MSARSGSQGTVQELDWDSRFFGLRIGALTGSGLDPAALDAALADARERRLECIYALTDVDDLRALRALESRSARLVDVRITLERKLEDIEAGTSANGIRPFRAEDVPVLRQLASRSHSTSRFYADGRFPAARCDELYATWIERSCEGWADFVLVADRGSGPCGYLSGHVREGWRGEIGLVAIAPTAQGEGFGTALVQAGMSEFRSRGLARSTVVTQGRSLVAQRLYQSCGYRTLRVQTWHHLWIDEVDRRR